MYLLHIILILLGHAPEAGPGPADVTAFHSPHSYWQEEREHRPEVLKKFLPPPNHTASTEKDVGFLYYKTSLVLDYRTHPLKAHDMPLTFSSNLEGWRLEAIRRTDPHISLKDIEARVPVVESLDSNGTFSCKPVCDENALAARARRFRERTGNVSWCAREGSEAIRKFMASLLTAEALRNNSALDRDLTKSEMAQLRMLNLGRNPERARKTNRSAADCKEARNKYVQKAHDLFTTTAGRETEKEVSRHYEAGHAYSASNAHSASTVHGASVAGNDYGFNNDHDASNTYVSSDIYGGSNVDGSSNDASNPDGLNNVNSAGYPSNTTSGYDSNFDHLMSGFDPVAHQEGIHSDEVPLTAACGTFSTDDLSSGNIDWSGVFDDNNVLDNQIFSAPEGGQFTAGDGLDTFSPMMNDRTFDLNETLGDSRYETPKSYNEVVDIRAALSPSVNEFIQTTAQYLYPKLPTGSYLVQHDRLQKYYEAQWWPQHQGQAPRLPIRVFWSGGIKNWLTSELLPTEVYGSEDLIRNNPNYFMGLGPST